METKFLNEFIALKSNYRKIIEVCKKAVVDLHIWSEFHILDESISDEKLANYFDEKLNDGEEVSEIFQYSREKLADTLKLFFYELKQSLFDDSDIKPKIFLNRKLINDFSNSFTLIANYDLTNIVYLKPKYYECWEMDSLGVIYKGNNKRILVCFCWRYS